VLYSKFGFMYQDLKLGDDEFILIREDDVIGVLPRSSEPACPRSSRPRGPPRRRLACVPAQMPAAAPPGPPSAAPGRCRS
jgi:hypothetical protein